MMRVWPAVCKGAAQKWGSHTELNAGVVYLCGHRGLGWLLVWILSPSKAVGVEEQGGAQTAGVRE